MKAIVVLRCVSGLEMWQVYTAQGLHSQHWSKEYAAAAAARLNAKPATPTLGLVQLVAAPDNDI